MRVLHVVESLGGVMSSVLSMVDATPDLEHHLALWPRREHLDPGDDRSSFAGVEALAGSAWQAGSQLRRTATVLRPDVVHAHSSYAGMLARAAHAGHERGTRLFYSPHCFAFERRDLSPTALLGIRAVERSLVARTDRLVACSPYEAELAVELGHAQVVVVPNRALHPPAGRAAYADAPFRVVTVGRICAQKDWAQLIAVKRFAEDVFDLHADWEWLGGGDADGARALRANGIGVSDWLPREQVMARLAAAQVYVHTAAWEGAPVSIQEAAAVGLPLALRAIPSVASLGAPGVAATVADLATRVYSLHHRDRWHHEQLRSLGFASHSTAQVQREALAAAYGFVPAALVLN
ncbi:glycosyltransferase [Nocardioides ultimimeridianus]